MQAPGFQAVMQKVADLLQKPVRARWVTIVFFLAQILVSQYKFSVHQLP